MPLVRHRFAFVPVALLLPLLLAPPAHGQEAVERLRMMEILEENAAAYAAPLTRGLAQALAGGYSDRASPLSFLGFDLGFRFLGARPGETEMTFDAILPDSVRLGGEWYASPFRPVDGSLSTPTIAGKGSGIALECTPEFEDRLRESGQDAYCEQAVVFPDGLSLPVVPVAVLHAAFGLGFGTDVSVNVLPPVEVAPEMGRTRSRGASARHALTHWFPSPVDLSVTAGYQEASAGDFLESSAWHYGLLAGVRAGPMSFFGGTQMREASTRIRYRLETPEEREISFETRVDTTPSYLLGARLQLLAMNLSGHYSFGEFDVFSLKLGFGLP
jgi:hypothetical protein